MNWYEWFLAGIGTGIAGMLTAAAFSALYVMKHPEWMVKRMLAGHRKKRSGFIPMPPSGGEEPRSTLLR